jgi:Restriction endonuclease
MTGKSPDESGQKRSAPESRPQPEHVGASPTIRNMADEPRVWLGRYPPADMTPEEFEQWTAQILEAGGHGLDKFNIAVHDRISGVDGRFDFDATVRFEWAGMSFLILVEAKRHKRPVERELVQVLQSKVLSVGAQKGVMFSTAGFQRGAIEFAKVHGMALVSVTEGRFVLETKSAEPRPPLTREQAKELWNLPTFVGHCYGPGDDPESTRITTIDERNPAYVRELLLGLPES